MLKPDLCDDTKRWLFVVTVESVLLLCGAELKVWRVPYVAWNALHSMKSMKSAEA